MLTPPMLTLAIALLACTSDRPSGPSGLHTDGGDADADTDTDTDTDADADTDTATLLEHCGEVVSDEVWGAGVHTVTCDVKVNGGTLTIASGAAVGFDGGAALIVGSDGAGSLAVEGTTDAPVTFGGTDWDGVTIDTLTAAASLAGLRLSGAGLLVKGVAVNANDIAIADASGCALTLTEGGGLADAAGPLSLHSTDAEPACVTADVAHTLPGSPSTYLSSGATAAVSVVSGDIVGSVVWAALDAPWRIDDSIELNGTAALPAVLTLSAGSILRMTEGTSIKLSSNGGASGFIAAGNDILPITIEGDGVATAGYWRGIDAQAGASLVSFAYTTLSGAGASNTPALALTGVVATLDTVAIGNCAATGLDLGDGASLAPSTGFTVRDCDTPIETNAAAVETIPVGAYSGNTHDVIVLSDGALVRSTVWTHLGVPYRADDDIEVDGTAMAPAILTLGEGVSIYFATGQGLFVSANDGAGGLSAIGTDAAWITLAPWDALTPGGWAGVSIGGASVDANTTLSYVDIGYAGGRSLHGNLQVTEAAPVLSHLRLHDSLEFGLYLDDATPVRSDITYATNISGDCFGCID